MAQIVITVKNDGGSSSASNAMASVIAWVLYKAGFKVSYEDGSSTTPDEPSGLKSMVDAIKSARYPIVVKTGSEQTERSFRSIQNTYTSLYTL